MSFDFLKNHKNIHFIGIGGISMSGLAEIMLNQGFNVSGSDRSSSKITDKLSKLGAKIYIGQDSSNIKDADLVVYTAAISEDNPELSYCKLNNIPLMNRAEFLGNVMKGHKYDIAVSGTHGKTTTTSMISHILMAEEVDPTILVGAELDIINGNVRAGLSEYFLTEACEYKESFLSFYPYIGIILNIDEDHLDFYRDINHIQDTFLKFSNLIPEKGYLVGNFDDFRIREISQNLKCNVFSYGLEHGDLRAKNVVFNNRGCGTFDVYLKNDKLFSISLNVPGTHNVSNSLSAIATALILDISHDSIIKGLFEFGGARRRFEFKGEVDNIVVIDDYAHHPTEIKTSIESAKRQTKGRIFAVFQPHTYTRTYILFDEFSKCFTGVDDLIIADIYAAREIDTGKVSSQMLSKAIYNNGVKCQNIHTFEDIVKYLKENAKPNDIVLTIGAGDVNKIGEMFLSELS